MGVPEKKPFPRGGRKVSRSVVIKKKPTLFRVPRTKQKKEKRQFKQRRKEKEDDFDLMGSMKQTTAQLIKFQTIVEGMLILGCVDKICHFVVKMSLPGHLCGTVPITNVSENYTRNLQEVSSGATTYKNHCGLKQMFKLGQHVTMRVTQVAQSTDGYFKVTLTTSPNAVHSNFSHRNVKKGLVLTAAVNSVEDHGYVMNLGIEGVHAFLNKARAQLYEMMWNDGNSLGIGQLVRCLVVKSSTSVKSTIVELSADPGKVAEAETDSECVTLQTLLPGMLFMATVTKVIHVGVQVTFGNNLTGYVHEDHLNMPKEVVSIGETYAARVLYILPTVKSVFLTMLNGVCSAQPLPSPFTTVQFGEVIDNAKVIQVGGHGLILRLQNGLRGFALLHHLPHKLEYDLNIPLGEQLRAMYPVHSKHRCRILRYDYMSQMYYCTLKDSEMKGSMKQLEDYQPGTLVVCRIKKVVNVGIEVQLGSDKYWVRGFVPACHMTDVPVSHPEKKFIQDSKHKARVLEIKNDCVWLTLKPTLITSKFAPLTDYKSIAKGDQCEGVVAHISPKGIVVVFYNGVKGYLPVSLLGYQTEDPTKSLYVGQTIKCYCANVNEDEERMTLGLISSHSQSKDLSIGHFYSVVVTSVELNHLCVKLQDSPIKGLIPMQHLADHFALAPLLISTFKEGDILPCVYCITLEKTPLFSLRHSVAQFYRSAFGQEMLTQRKNIEKRPVLCSVKCVQTEGVWLNIHLPGIGKNAYVPLDELCNDPVTDINSIGLQEHQVLMAKLSKINSATVSASTKLPVWHKKNMVLVQCGVELLKNYMKDSRRILSHLSQKGDPLSHFAVGNTVTGVVQTVTHVGAVLRLKGGVCGVVMPYHFKGKLRPGEVVDGKILLIDLLNNCVEVTLRQKYVSKIDSVQGGDTADIEIGSYLRGEVLVIKPEQIIVLPKKQGQLVSVPVRFHLNDLFPSTPLYELGKCTKIAIVHMEDGIIIGISNKQFPELFRMGYDVLKKKINRYFNHDESSADTNKDCGNKEKVYENKSMETEVVEEISLNHLSNVNSDGVDDDDPAVGAVKKQKRKKSRSSNNLEHLNPISSQTDDLQLSHEIGYGVKLKPNKPVVTEKLSKTEVLAEKSKQKRKLSVTVDMDDSCTEIDKLQTSPGSKKAKMHDTEIKGKNKITKRNKGSENNESTIDGETDKNTEGRNNEIYCVNDIENSDSMTLDSSPKLIKKNHKSQTYADDYGLFNIKDSNQNGKVSESNFVALSENIGFVWNAKPELLPAVAREKTLADTSSDEDETEQQTKKKKLTPAEKRDLARKEEEHLREIERQLLDAAKNPQSADDFDRLVLSSPNNSVFWIKYMAFHLQATEIEKARAVAEQALKTISFREEQEKLNVWLALLSLENLYGTKESLDKTLQEAVRMNDAFKVYMQMLQIFVETGKIQEVDKMVQIVTKKFRDNKNMWLKAGEVYMSCRQLEKSRALMQKALVALDKKDHVEIISRFALMENKFGEAERAQTLMEHILTSYPKLVNIWNSYVDMLVKSGHIELARQVLERAVIQKLPVRKTKALYKKFLDFETQHGTQEGVNKVRQMALEYVESSGANMKETEN